MVPPGALRHALAAGGGQGLTERRPQRVRMPGRCRTVRGYRLGSGSAVSPALLPGLRAPLWQAVLMPRATSSPCAPGHHMLPGQQAQDGTALVCDPHAGSTGSSYYTCAGRATRCGRRLARAVGHCSRCGSTPTTEESQVIPEPMASSTLLRPPRTWRDGVAGETRRRLAASSTVMAGSFSSARATCLSAADRAGGRPPRGRPGSAPG